MAELRVLEHADSLSVLVHVKIFVVDFVELHLEVLHVPHHAYNVVGFELQVDFIDPR